jgi:ferredoxin
LTTNQNLPHQRDGDDPRDPSLPILDQPSTRRSLLKIAGAALGLAAFGQALSPLVVIPKNVSIEEFLQQHYKELNDDEKKKVFARLEAETKERYGAEVTISDPRPIPGVRFGYAINLSKCNGNGKCMEACNQENNHHRGVDQSYIRVLEMSKGSMDMEHGSTTYDHTVPSPRAPLKPPGKKRMALSSSITTGALAVDIVRPPAPIMLDDSTGKRRKFRRRKSIPTKVICRIGFVRRGRWKSATSVSTEREKVEPPPVRRPVPPARASSET